MAYNTFLPNYSVHSATLPKWKIVSKYIMLNNDHSKIHTKIQMSWTSLIMSHQDKLSKILSWSLLHKQDIQKGKHRKNGNDKSSSICIMLPRDFFWLLVVCRPVNFSLTSWLIMYINPHLGGGNIFRHSRDISLTLTTNTYVDQRHLPTHWSQLLYCFPLPLDFLK